MLIIKNLFVIHPSLLPKYRGASPIHYALLNGDESTGVSVAAVSPKKFDAGIVFLQESLKVENSDTYGTLVKKLGKIGGDLASKMINQDYQKTGLFVQDETKVTKAPKFDKDANILFFSTQSPSPNSGADLSSRHTFNMCRMFRGSSHGYLKFSYKGKKVGFEDLVLLEDRDLQPETGKIANPTQLQTVKQFAGILPVGSLHQFKNVAELKGMLALRLKDGFLLAKKITYEGSARTVPVAEFLREAQPFGPAYQEFIGLVVGGKQEVTREVVEKAAVMLD